VTGTAPSVRGATNVDQSRIASLFERAEAKKWGIPLEAFAEAIEASVAHAFTGRERTRAAVDRYMASLHLADLALACACLRGSADAWEAFVREYRPVLYRAADALDPSGGARDVADALYAELYERRLLTYFHARSSLGTWLRAVLSQRYIDRVRAGRRYAPLSDDDDSSVVAAPATSSPPDPDRVRLFPLLMMALKRAVAVMDPRDRLRLACYYSQDLTLAQTGRMLGEHEATVSRQLARTRRKIRDAVERHLREDARLSEAEIAACFDSAVADPGALDVQALFGRKNSAADRSS
jgi:RNA polymerase sigma factor (sigma-70 family)